jgi:hypothetical protein
MTGFRRNFGNWGGDCVYRWQARVLIEHFSISQNTLEKKEKAKISIQWAATQKKLSHTTFTGQGVVILNLGDVLVTAKGKVLNTQDYLTR